jgi:hypothetical protein
MGWSSWFKDGNGDQVSQKKVSTSNGGSQSHFLRAKTSDRKDHSHVVVNRSSSGKITSAHATPTKSKR